MRRDKIGFIFQFFNLRPSLSCMQNVSLPLHLKGLPKRETTARATTACAITIWAAPEWRVHLYDGHNSPPLFTFQKPQPLTVDVERYYPQMRMYGAEAAYFTSTTTTEDEYGLYVVQVERQAGEWFFIGGYAGQVVTEHPSVFDFAADRRLTRAFLGRPGYTIDANRSVVLKTAIRQNGQGEWAKLEYSPAFGAHWRATAAFTLIRGDESDFLGQYRRNSHAMLALRYSF
ncbi:MAG TPA: hypothetical protein VN924_17405 [Bryobacteraceae bacterium]|nr:hypothetical protein [Bryobacteraceae bacterium]